MGYDSLYTLTVYLNIILVTHSRLQSRPELLQLLG